MPSYNLDALGATEFERLVQSLLKKVIGSGTITFGPGPDGGREATFSGMAPYPSAARPWTGEWIFQVKYHDTARIGAEKARKQVVRDLEVELTKITQKYRRKCDNYILVTNVPLSATPTTGTLDQIFDNTVTKFQAAVQNIHVWGKDEVDRFLESNPDVRTAYAHFITAGDILAKLLRTHDEKLNDLETTIQAYISTQFLRDQYAQLDQAGDVTEDPIRLQQVIFELNSRLDLDYVSGSDIRGETLTKLRSHPLLKGTAAREGAPTVRFLVSEIADRAVLVGGPGEGKSTIGQYVAQLHRANLLGRIGEIALSPEYTPVTTRLPLRVILRDFAQWIAEGREKDNGSAKSRTLDRFICQQIESATARSITGEDLHVVIQANPTLLILDGLDEVSEPQLQKEVLDRLAEFSNKCTDILRANLQVIATTRPTGYTDQFDPRRFIHLRLRKLTPSQVGQYVTRLSKAKDLETVKANRLCKDIDECLADDQVRLLMNTPLQVTILVLIILNGGTPPRQREALFDEYLEVIYKRETGKGRNVISSEKELLIGLHKYVGYMLQEKATDGTTTGSYLTREQYEENLRTFLRHHNPYESSRDRERQIVSISRDAGERLVLIVEQHPNAFGFELRSIQEFFAACHLTDTSRNTEQRYIRFREIAGLSHWRNVALFFAGRVGRNFSGESANIVDVCREYDRQMPDRLIRRGAWLALELAADRAFGHNRRHQRGLIDVGLTVLESYLSRPKLSRTIELLTRLPDEDISQHVLPLLAGRVELWTTDRLGGILSILAQIAPADALFQRVVEKTSQVADCRASILETLLKPELSFPADVIKKIPSLVASLTDSEICDAIEMSGGWRRIVEPLLRLDEEAGIDQMRLLAIVMILIQRGALTSWLQDEVGDEHLARFIRGAWGTHPGMIAIRAAYVIAGSEVHSGYYHARGTALSFDEFLDGYCVNIPSRVINGDVDAYLRAHNGDSEVVRELVAILWFVHLAIGNVNDVSVSRMLEFFWRAKYSDARALIDALTRQCNPGVSLALRQLIEGRGRPGRAERILLEYGGAAGQRKWSADVNAVHRRLREMSAVERKDVVTKYLSGLSVRKELGSAARALGSKELIEGALAEVWRADKGRPVSMQYMESVLRRLENGKPLLGDGRLIIRHMLEKPDLYSQLYVRLIRVLTRKRDLNARGELAQVLVRCIAYEHGTDEIWRAGLETFSAAAELRRLEVTLPLSQRGHTRTVRYLASLAADEHDEASLGAMKLLVDYCLSFRRRRMSPPIVSAITRYHRRLNASRLGWARMAGAALFAVRRPSSAEDWRTIEDLLSQPDSIDGLAPTIYHITSIATVDVERRAQWQEILERVIPLVESPFFHGDLVDRLSEIVDGGTQSLSLREGALGLPLQEE